jgi:hypothetical protein
MTDPVIMVAALTSWPWVCFTDARALLPSTTFYTSAKDVFGVDNGGSKEKGGEADPFYDSMRTTTQNANPGRTLSRHGADW